MNRILLLSWFCIVSVAVIAAQPPPPPPAQPPPPPPTTPPPNPCQWGEPLKDSYGNPQQCSLSQPTSCPKDFNCFVNQQDSHSACCLAQDPNCKDMYPYSCYEMATKWWLGGMAVKCNLVASSFNFLPKDAQYVDKSTDKVNYFCQKTCRICGAQVSLDTNTLYQEKCNSDPAWQIYTKKYGKNYTNDAEEGLFRLELFANCTGEVVEHNQLYSNGQSEWTMDTNQYATWTTDERQHLLGLKLPLAAFGSGQQVLGRKRRKRAADQVPKVQDWTSYMGAVRNQGSCGGCWAFATTSTIQAYRQMNQNASDQLSVQQLLECDRTVSPTYGVANDGCDGGYFQIAAEYLSDHGQTTEQLLPFLEKTTDVCPTLSTIVSPKITAFDMGYVTPSATKTAAQLEADMVARVAKQPVAVGIAVSNDFFLYKSGVYDSACGDTINHAVTLVGYTPDFWIVQNSWGSDWGENGYIRIKRGDDRCQLTHYWATPTALEGTATTTAATTATTKAATTATIQAETTATTKAATTATSGTTKEPTDAVTQKPKANETSSDEELPSYEDETSEEDCDESEESKESSSEEKSGDCCD